MTSQATRDALAEMDGWSRIHEDTDTGKWRWKKTLRTGDVDKRGDHPHPPTLDGADAAVTAAGYVWDRRHGYWIGWENTGNCARIIRVPISGETPEHKIADLYALALACRKAMEASKKPPTLEDLHAMKIDITGGQDAADYVNEQRMKDEESPNA